PSRDLPGQLQFARSAGQYDIDDRTCPQLPSNRCPAFGRPALERGSGPGVDGDERWRGSIRWTPCPEALLGPESLVARQIKAWRHDPGAWDRCTAQPDGRQPGQRQVRG